MYNPYDNVENDKEKIMKTKSLIKEHPFTRIKEKEEDINNLSTIIEIVWQKIENCDIFGIKLIELQLSTSALAQILEKLLTSDLKSINGDWKNGNDKEKDLIYEKDEKMSVELKTSGQSGKTKIFGNASYAKDSISKKNKNGYYLTVNFDYKLLKLGLIRFGWINKSDLKAQESESGQASTLNETVYKTQLLVIKGNYLKNTPVSFINGIGPKFEKDLKDKNIQTVGDLLEETNNKHYKKALEFYESEFIN